MSLNKMRRRLLVANHRQTASPGIDGRSHRGIPFAILRALAPAIPFIAAAIGVGAMLAGGVLRGHRATRDRDALFHQRTNFLGLRDRRDDPTLDLRLVVVELRVALRQKERAGQRAQQRPLMSWIAAKNPAFFSVSHGRSALLATRAVKMFKLATAAIIGPPPNPGKQVQASD